MNNAVRTFVLNKMVDFLLFLGKMVIVVGASTMSYFVFYGYFPELLGDTYGKIPHLNYSFTPIICIAVGTYFITTSFFNVYSMAVDTLFLCFLQDIKQNDGTPQRPYFMSKGINHIQIINSYSIACKFQRILRLIVPIYDFRTTKSSW